MNNETYAQRALQLADYLENEVPPEKYDWDKVFTKDADGCGCTLAHAVDLFSGGKRYYVFSLENAAEYLGIKKSVDKGAERVFYHTVLKPQGDYMGKGEVYWRRAIDGLRAYAETLTNDKPALEEVDA